ncbi:MAG: aspartate aminotransferase family protein [Phycisphaerae bacterium]|nr:aspartate aminotransferase family protein [Phycisphaerae bacterium]
MLDLERLLAERGTERLDLIAECVNPVFARVLRTLGYDIPFVQGRGQYLWDEAGHRYLDCIGGFGTFACGRNHPKIRQVIKQAMDLDLPNLPKFAPPALSGLLAEKLIAVAPGDLDTVYFCNSGAEAIETAIKYARCATSRPRMVYCHKAYHGLTLGALSINGGQEFREGFEPIPGHTTPIPFNDLTALECELNRGDVAGFVVEPVQGKGVFVPDDDYLPAAADLCRRHGALFVADEVQTGFGRTGRMFACDHWGVEPDILCAAKALSGGYVPCAAVLTRRWIHRKVFSRLDRVVVHSTTFGQNDLAMAAGLATLDVLQEEQIVENAAAMGRRLITGLRDLADEFDLVQEVRGLGLMVGVELGPPTGLALKMGWKLLHRIDAGLFPQAVLIPLLQDHRVLALVAGHQMDVIKLLPALVIDEQDVDHLISALRTTIQACYRFPGPVWEITRRLSGLALRSADHTSS